MADKKEGRTYTETLQMIGEVYLEKTCLGVSTKISGEEKVFTVKLDKANFEKLIREVEDSFGTVLNIGLRKDVENAFIAMIMPAFKDFLT